MKTVFAIIPLASILFAGCASQRTSDDLKNSGYVLYPIAKVGELVSVLGSGVTTAASPGAWTPKEETKFQGAPTKEQLDEINQVSVKWDRKFDPLATSGLGIGSSALPDPFRSVIFNVESMAGFSFDWYLNPNLPDIAMAFPGGVIMVNPMVMSLKSPPAQTFTLLHETGHQILGHTTGYSGMLKMSQPWMAPAMEMECDAFAAKKMLAAGIPPQLIVYGLLEIVGNSPFPPDPGHPAGLTRVLAVKQIVGL